MLAVRERKIGPWPLTEYSLLELRCGLPILAFEESLVVACHEIVLFIAFSSVRFLTRFFIRLGKLYHLSPYCWASKHVIVRWAIVVVLYRGPIDFWPEWIRNYGLLIKNLIRALFIFVLIRLVLFDLLCNLNHWLLNFCIASLWFPHGFIFLLIHVLDLIAPMTLLGCF